MRYLAKINDQRVRVVALNRWFAISEVFAVGYGMGYLIYLN